MELKQLKAATSSLPRVDTLAGEFEKHLEKHFDIEFPEQRRAEVHSQLKQLKKALKEVGYGQVVNDKLASLAHQLVDLKVASVTSDHKKTKRIINSFLKDPHGGIKQVIFEVPYLESQLSLLRNSYTALIDQLHAELPLEQSIDLSSSPALKKLLAVSEQQKKYLSLIGKHFVELTRELKEKKEFRKEFKNT